MLNSITFFPVFGIPLIVYGGIVTFGFFMAVAYTGATQKPIKVHKTLAAIAVALGLVHGLLGILSFF
jgi:hypothetical protein